MVSLLLFQSHSNIIVLYSYMRSDAQLQHVIVEIIRWLAGLTKLCSWLWYSVKVFMNVHKIL